MNFPKPTFAFALFAPLLLCACQYIPFFSPSPEDAATETPTAEESVSEEAVVVAPAPVAVAPVAPKPTIAPGQPGYIKQQAKIGEATMAVKAQLDNFALSHVKRANATIKPNRSRAEVNKEKGMYVARYLEVDADTLTTEIYPSTGQGSTYIGHVVYLEKTYESIGDTKMQAESGTFKQTRARRIREITRYSKGAWVY